MTIRLTEAELARLLGDDPQEPPSRARRGPNAESAIQTAIVEALRYAGCWVLRLNSGAIRAGSRPITLAPAGTPDLLVVAPGGRVVFLEVKTSTGRLSAAQRAMHAELTRLGATVAVVRSVEEALAVVGMREEG